MTEDVRKIFMGQQDSKSTDFGDVCKCHISCGANGPDASTDSHFKFQVRASSSPLCFCTSKAAQTGDKKLKALEENIFVGSGRFVVEAGKDLAVEYQIGRIVG